MLIDSAGGFEMTTKMLAVVIGGSLAAVPAASADDAYVDADVNADVDVESPGMYSYAWMEPRLASVIGVGVTIGGGVSGFTDGLLRDTVDSDVSGAWAARATIGTHIPIGLDISYTGTAVDLQPLGQTGTGQLVGTNVEGAVRWNILPHFAVNPYVFAGMGWQRYDVRDADFSLSDARITEDENLVVFPTGIGVAYRDMSGITFEARGTLRWAGDSELIADTSGSFADLHTWDATANVGYEF
jgi:hypothetical protein